MTGLQELIHKLELGEGARVLKVGTALLAVIALTVWYDLREYRNLHAPEAMETAQLARNLSRGEGFTTKCIRPLSIAMVEATLGPDARISRRAHPDLATPPVYPLLLSWVMKIVPLPTEFPNTIGPYAVEMTIAILNQILFFAMVWLTYRLARRLFDTPVAVLTSVILLGCELLWRFSVSGLSTMLLLLVLVGLVWTLVRLETGVREGTPSRAWVAGWAAGAGLLLALGGLTRYAFAWLIVPVLFFCALYLGKHRGLACTIVAASFLVVFVPWLARNFHYGGTFFGVQSYALQQDTPRFPDTKLERQLSTDVSQVDLNDYFRKLLVNGGEIMANDLPKLGGSWVTAFFLVGLLLPFRNPLLGRLRIFLLMSLAVLSVVQALGHTHLSGDTPSVNTENLLVVLVPLVFMYGVAFFQVLLEQAPLPFVEARHYVAGLFGAVCCGSLVFALLPPRTYTLVYPPYLPPWIQESARLLRTNELMMSDMPWAVAWYGDRSCVWLTLDPGRSFYAVHDEHKGVSALYLTPLTTDARFLTQIVRGTNWVWSQFAVDVLLHTNLPPRFPLRDARAGYVPDQVFLSDRARWKERPR